MKIDYKKLIPAEVTDEVAYYIGEFLHSLIIAFDNMHIAKSVRYEKALIEE